MSDYSEKLKDPRWQGKRLEMFDKSDNKCNHCGCNGIDNPLQLHHRYYRLHTEPWDYPDHWFIVLCEDCHRIEHQYDYIFESLIDEIMKTGLNYDQIKIYLLLPLIICNDDKSGTLLYDMINSIKKLLP
jgi:hypothetical protein